MNSRKRWPNLEKNLHCQGSHCPASPGTSPFCQSDGHTAVPSSTPALNANRPHQPPASSGARPFQQPVGSAAPRRAGHNAGCTATLHQHPPPSAPTQRSCRSPAAAAYYAAAWPRSNVERKVTRPRCGPARPLSFRIRPPTKRFL